MNKSKVIMFLFFKKEKKTFKAGGDKKLLVTH